MTADVIPGQLSLLDTPPPTPPWTPGERRIIPHPYQANEGVMIAAVCSATPGLLVSRLRTGASWVVTTVEGLSVDEDSRTRAEGLLLCDRLAGLTDWTSPTCHRTAITTPELLDRAHVAILSVNDRRASAALDMLRQATISVDQWDTLHAPGPWNRPQHQPGCACQSCQLWAQDVASSDERREQLRRKRDRLIGILATLTVHEGIG